LDRICASKDVAGLATVPYPDYPRELTSCAHAMQALQTQSTSSGRQALALAQRRRVGLVSIFLHSDPTGAAAEQYVKTLSNQPPIPGYRVLIGGLTRGQLDFDNFLYARFPYVVLFVLVTIFAVLLFAFRSVLLPLKAVIMNIFSIGAAYGAVVFAFQDGHLRALLGFTPVGNVDSIVPVFLFCVLFGISTDYEVFLLARVQEQYLATGSNEESVATGLEVTGRIITSAALVMIVVFGAFSFARLVVIKEIGLGLAVAVLVDATLIRALLVPATMRLLGKWNWWLPVRGFPAILERDAAPAGRKTPAAE
jgi:RND superfamily putative drug exporter